MSYSRSPAGTASRLGRKKYRSAEREDDFFPADPKGPALRSGGDGYLCFKETGVSCPSEKIIRPRYILRNEGFDMQSYHPP